MSPDVVVAMDTSPVDRRTAAAIERAEAHAWADMYAAAPADFAGRAGLASTEVGGAVVLRWAATGRRYFSRAIALGVTEPATREVVDRILDVYERSGIDMFLLQSLPHCRPTDYSGWLSDRGLEPFDAQDRIVRGREPFVVSEPPEDSLTVERVDRQTQDEWADFLQRVYRLDTGGWLQTLIDRAGWHQYVARREGEVIAARGMYIGRDGIAWLGMDGPVPGIMTDDHEPDAAICAFVLEDGLRHGARGFIADIEAPSAAMDTPAYDHFARLGFRRPYVRTHHARV